ncbi:hypothetical protein WJX79_008278 [Trebouxia sp. C0005]
MAARHLQKLRAQDLSSSDAIEDNASESGEETTGPLNPFDLLDDKEADDGETEQTVAPESETPEEQPKQDSKSSAAKKKKKAKQKQKKVIASTAAATSANKAVKQQPATQAEDNIDQLLASLNIPQTVHSAASTSGRSSAKPSNEGTALLGVNPAKLKADDEMRRIFGSKVVDAEARNESAGGMVGASRRVRRLMARGLIKRSVLKAGLLIVPKEHWPPFEGGLSMELAGTTVATSARSHQLFKYTHSAAYHAVQMLFEQSQASFDPNTIMALLQQHPYHVDALLTMHELYRSMGEVAASDEMLERCIYALEMAWHPYFNPGTANTRMDFGHPPNRPLFIALFKQTQNLSRRGLHGTALEYAKLLLGLDPGDPTGVLFCIDYLAIRAHQYNFLRRLVSEDGDLCHFPLFSYSTLLAEFRQRTGHTADKQGRGSGFAPAAGPSSSHKDEATGEAPLEQRLSHAVMMYPIIVVRLMDKLQDKGVGKDAEWGSLLEKPPLRHADDTDSATLSHAADIYVERHHLLWKAHDAQRLLKDACSLAVQASPEEQSNWACMREDAWRGVPADVNTYRRLRVADFSDTVSALPPEELQAAMGAGGMAGRGPGPMAGDEGQLPPQLLQAMQHGVDEEMLADMLGNIPADQAAELQRLVQEGGLAPPDVGNEEIEAANPWAMLLRTFLPWVNAGQVPDYINPEEEEEAEHYQEADGTEHDVTTPEEDDLD